MKNDLIEIKIPVDHAKNLIKSLFKLDFTEEKKDKIANILLSNLKSTELGLEQLINSVMDIYPIEIYKVGDWVNVNIEYLWRLDKKRTRESKYVKNINDAYYLSCKIVEIIPTSRYKYKIEYNAYSTDETENVLLTDIATEAQIHSLDTDHINHVLEEIDEIIEENLSVSENSV
jgi:hypothetical protein